MSDAEMGAVDKICQVYNAEKTDVGHVRSGAW